MMSLAEYLTPDPNIPAPIPSPTVIHLPGAARASRTFSLRDKGSSRGAIIVNNFETLFESKLEYWAALAFRAHPDVADVIDQPPAVEFVDDDGEIRDHTFDFLVVRRDGTRIAVVVKPSKLVAKNGVERMVELLAEQTPRRFADFVTLVTEKHLTPHDKFNAELIDAARCKPDVAVDAIVAKLVRTMRGTATIGALVARTKRNGAGYRAVVRAIADGRLKPVEPCSLTYDAVVRRAPNRRK